jgi:GAF domain-containing protein
VARDASAMGNPETLMQQMVDLIADRFGFYYAAIFLIEPGGQFAELKAGTGEAGRQMIARGHKLHIGQVGIVGYVTSTGEPRVSLDVGGDSVHYRNPLLPDTQSEMALPLKVGVRVIGALDVQSREKNAFSQEDVQTLQLMADQLAFVIENARLFSENQAALEASRRAYSELGRRAWLDLLRIRSIGYRADHLGVNPLPSQNGGLHPAAASPQVIDLPIVVRDQVIGVVQAHKPETRGGWSPTEQALMKTLISQLGEALDSARLYNDMQRRAAREKLTSDIATRIRQTLDVETVLRSAADEIYHSLALEEVTVALVEENQAPIAASQPGAPDAAQAIG